MFVNVKTIGVVALGSLVALATPSLAQDRGRTGTDSGMSRGLDSGVNRGLDSGVNRGLDSGVNRGLDSGVNRGQDSGTSRGLDTGRSSTERTTTTGSRIPR